MCFSNIITALYIYSIIGPKLCGPGGAPTQQQLQCGAAGSDTLGSDTPKKCKGFSPF